MDEQGRVADQMPSTIGRYQVLESIGYGAMGAVYKAFDPLIKRTLAIKTIRLDIPRSSPQYRSFIDRFYHEARISGTLSHPNIVTLFDIGEESGLPYLAMEFVEGQTVASLIEAGTRFKAEKVVSLISQVASAIDYAHSKGVIHRDIKPSNLILYDAERIKVTDFGIAKLVDAEMTQSGTLLGTPAYMSPEQAMGDKLDGRSDIFSLGVCAFEMLSGEQPFGGPNVTSILYKLVHVDPVEPANLEMSGLIPQKWREVFGKVLAKKPDDRYQTATEFVQDLEYCLGSWFGGVGETISDDTDVGIRAIAQAAHAVAPSATAGDHAATHAIPGPIPAEPIGDEYQATVVMDSTAVTARGAAVAAAEAAEGTLLVSAGALPAMVAPRAPEPPPADSTMLMPSVGAPPAESTMLMPSVGAAPVVDSTLLMPGPVAAPPPPAPEDDAPATVLIRSPRAVSSSAPVEPPAPPTVFMPAAPPPMPAPSPDDAPPTVLVSKAAVRGATAARAVDEAPPTAIMPGPPAREVAPAARTAKKGGPPVALVAGGAAALLLLAAGAFFLVKRGTAREEVRAEPSAAPPTALTVPPPPPSTAVVPQVTGTLSIASTPAGAAVTVDGQARGVTPLELADLALGAHEVKLDLKGYATGEQKVVLSPEAPRSELKIALSRTAPAQGTAEVTSQPSGALVKINGVPAGHTPFMDKLKLGSHTVEVAKDGFEPWSGSIAVKAGKKTAIHAWLKGMVRATPTPVPTFDPNRIHAVNEVDTQARKVSGATASYPGGKAPKLKSGQTVSVTVSFVVNQDGTVSDVSVVEPGGAEVDREVSRAVAGWKYTPAVKNGVKVKTRMTFKQTFRAG